MLIYLVAKIIIIIVINKLAIAYTLLQAHGAAYTVYLFLTHVCPFLFIQLDNHNLLCQQQSNARANWLATDIDEDDKSRDQRERE